MHWKQNRTDSNEKGQKNRPLSCRKPWPRLLDRVTFVPFYSLTMKGSLPMKNIGFEINKEAINTTWLKEKLDQCGYIEATVKVLRDFINRTDDAPFTNYDAANELHLTVSEFASAMKELSRVGIITVEVS